MSFWSGKHVLVTGRAGFVGSRLVRLLKCKDVAEIAVPRSATCDLTIRENCRRVVKGKDVVVHLAARVGGIGLNQEKPGELFFDNLMMGSQLMEEARLAQVEKFVAVGTICSYPKFTPVPFKEEDLWDGYPEETNAPYGLAKKMLLVQSQAYRRQYGFNAIFLMPVNIYGPGDNFDPHSSHVIPALIKRIFDTRKSGADMMTVWGDGSPTREFLYVDDAARGIALAAEKYNKCDPINLGTGHEISIRELVALMMRLADFHGKVVWDTTKPNGQPRRLVDVARARTEFGFEAAIPLEEGLKRTIAWYRQRNML